jgi:hypothetical protein
MLIPYPEADHIFRAQKRLLEPMEWDSRSRGGREHKCLECRIQMDGGAVPRGVFFRIVTYPEFLDSLTFQLECERPEARGHVTLYRLEVALFRSHMNKVYGHDEINGRFFAAGETHEHDFHDSLTQDGNLRMSSCEQARPVIDPPHDFATALARVCSRINIINGNELSAPHTQGSLF